MNIKRAFKGQIRCKRWFARIFGCEFFSFFFECERIQVSHDIFISCILVDRQKMFWMINSQRFWLTTQSKGDHKKGLHTTQIKKKGKELSVYFPRQISKQFHPVCARKRKREICLNLMIWGLTLFWKSYNIWRPRGRIGHLFFNGGEESDHNGTNQLLQYQSMDNRRFMKVDKAHVMLDYDLISWLALVDF